MRINLKKTAREFFIQLSWTQNLYTRWHRLKKHHFPNMPNLKILKMYIYWMELLNLKKHETANLLFLSFEEGCLYKISSLKMIKLIKIWWKKNLITVDKKCYKNIFIEQRLCNHHSNYILKRWYNYCFLSKKCYQKIETEFWCPKLTPCQFRDTSKFSNL